MVTATSTLCTAVYPDLDLRLAAGIPTPVDPQVVPRLAAIDGVVVTVTPDPKPEHAPSEEK